MVLEDKKQDFDETEKKLRHKMEESYKGKKEKAVKKRRKISLSK